MAGRKLRRLPRPPSASNVVLHSDRVPSDEMTLREVKEIIAAGRNQGIDCPACSQRVKVYRRTITDKMALALLAHHELFGTRWGDITRSKAKIKRPSNDHSFLVHWGLFEHRRDRDGNRIGSDWRVTETGQQWLTEQISVPRYADVLLGRCLRCYGPPTTVTDALGRHFDLDALLAD